MYRLLIPAACVLLAVGCSPTPTPTGSSPPTTAEPESPAGPPLITVTPAAKVALIEAAAEMDAPKVWWVRLTIKPGGCTGFQSKLDLDPLGVEPGDRETTCDGVRILYRADQEFAVQGAEIDFVNTPKERGFSVKYPNQSERNKSRTQEWVRKELDAIRPPVAADDE